MTSENPHEPKRRRRWPRFKLSTILVLVAVTAWAMSMRPWAAFDARVDPGLPAIHFDGSVELHGKQPMTMGNSNAQIWRKPKYNDCIEVTFTASRGAAKNRVSLFVGPPLICWPIFALAAFLTWKWIAARRKRLREQAVSPSPAQAPPHS